MKRDRSGSTHDWPDTAEGWWSRLSADTPPERAALEAWSRWMDRPDNARAYRELERLWRGLDAGLTDPQLRAWLAEAESAPAHGSLRARRTWIGATAAVLGVAAMAAWMLPRWQAPADAPAAAASTDVYRTARGELRRYRLPDGSRLYLDVDSHVEYAQDGERRQLRLLAGRLRLDVATDARPLRVEAPGLRLRDIGTVFDLEHRDQATRVSLFEGALEATGAGRRETLRPGQSLRVGEGVWHLAELGPEALAAAGQWVDGRIVFEGETLAEVARVLGRYGTTDVCVDPADPAARLRVSGVFRVGRQQAFIEALQQVHPQLGATWEEDCVRLAAVR